MKSGGLSLLKYKRNISKLFENYNFYENNFDKMISEHELENVISVSKDFNLLIPKFETVLLSLKFPDLFLMKCDVDVLYF